MADINNDGKPAKPHIRPKGGGHKANFVINRRQSLKNPPPLTGKPRMKPKPAVLARWNITDKNDSEPADENPTNVKAQARLFEGRGQSDNNNHKPVKPPISHKPKLLPKPGQLQTELVKSSDSNVTKLTAAAGHRQNLVGKPVVKPRKIAKDVDGDSAKSPRGGDTDNITKSLADKLSLDNSKSVSKTAPLVSGPNVAGSNSLATKSVAQELNTNVKCAGDGGKLATNIGPRKLRQTFLRGIETALQGDSKPLMNFRRKSETEMVVEDGIVRSRWSQGEDGRGSEHRVDDDSQLVEEEESSEGSDYDDVEVILYNTGANEGGGWEDVTSSSVTKPVDIPQPVAPPRRVKKSYQSDRGTRRKKIHSKERFKSNPDPVTTSGVYDDPERYRESDMSQQDNGWETDSSGSDGYEKVEERRATPPPFIRSTENISLPIAKSPQAPGIIDKVKLKMGKTVNKAKNKFFTSRQTSSPVDFACHSPADSASPVGSPQLRGKFISPPIPDRSSGQKSNMKSSTSEPVLTKDFGVSAGFKKRAVKQRYSLTPSVVEEMPSHPPPPRPLSSFDSFESSAEEVLPPVPPRGASREHNAVGVKSSSHLEIQQSLDIQDAMALCQSLEDLTQDSPRLSQVQDFYIEVPPTGEHHEEVYSDIDVQPQHLGSLRKQSTTESEAYIDWGEVESSNKPDVTPKDRADSNASSSNSEPNYLEFAEEDNQLKTSVSRKKRFQSRFMKFEPLYQEYTKNVIARCSWERRGTDSSFDIEEADEDQLYHELDKDSGESESPFEEPCTATLATKLSTGTAIRKTFYKKTSSGMRTMWSEMPEVRGSGVLEDITPQEKKVQEAMFEVITSEASYLKSINVLIDIFLMSPEFSSEHSVKCVVDRRSKHFLFSNLLAVREVSERLLFDLEARWQESTDFMLENVCDIIYKHASERFECYIKYCSNQIYQERTLKELMKNQEFQEARLRIEANPECQGLNMTSFLLLPMQRITRLPLLIDAICHRLNPETELERHQTALNALIVLKKMVKQCNDGAKQMEQTEEMCLIDRQLVFKDPVKKIGLISANRHLVKRGELTRIVNDLGGKRPFGKAKATKQVVYLFLFTDLLLITKKKSEDLYSVIDYAKRSSLLIEPINDAANEPRLKLGVPSKCEHLFILVLLENYEGKSIELILSCESPSDRARWMEGVTPPIQENPDEKIYESWDCPQVQVIHAYTAQQPDELTLEESDVVNILRKVGDGWYEGERIRDGQKGWFPVDYTVEIKNSHVRNRNLRQRYRLLAAASKAISDLPPSKQKRSSAL